jgi:predicted nucleic acid-binding protein
MKIVIDSNVLFSALRPSESRTRNLLMTSNDQYVCPNFIFLEIFRHKERIVQSSQQNEQEIITYLALLLSKIHFVNEENISTWNFIQAYQLCKDVDEDDTPFLALALELNLPFWTRDKALKSALQIKGFNNFFIEPD